MLDLHRLRILRELRARGTVRATAAALGYSPGAISQQLGVLEREAGTTLFEHVGRRLRLTPAGELLATHADTLLESAEAARADVAGLDAGEPTGTVRIAAFQSAFLHILTPAIATLADRHPGIRVEAVEAEIEESARTVSLQRIDIAIGDEYEGQPREIHPRLVREHLLTESIRVVLPTAMGRTHRGEVALETLADRAWASCQPEAGHHQMFVAACRGRGRFEPDVRYYSDDFLILLRTVRTTGAVALLPSLALIDHGPGVVSRAMGAKPVTREVFLLSRASAGPAVRAVVAALQEAAAHVDPDR